MLTVLLTIIKGILGPLLDSFRQRQKDVDDRTQVERITREAELARAEEIRTRENLDVAKNRAEIDDTVRTLDDDALLAELRDSVRKPSSSDADNSQN